MSTEQDAASVIDETLTAIAADDDAALVAQLLRGSWNGQRFDEGALRDALASLTQTQASE